MSKDLPVKTGSDNMDFLKGCKTNVQIYDKVNDTKFRVLGWDDALPDSGGRISTFLIQARRRGILCLEHDRQLWFFGQHDQQIQESLKSAQDCMSLLRGGTLQEDAAGSNSRSEVVIQYLRALELSLAFKLAEESGLQHIGHWTWITAGSDVANAQRLVQLRLKVHLSTAGALHITTVSEQSRLTPVHRTKAEVGLDVLLAPNGQAARVLDPTDDGILSGNEWNQSVKRTLNSHGVAVDKDVEWLPVLVTSAGGHSKFQWPVSLCFVTKADAQCPAEADPARDVDHARCFLGTDPRGGSYNPLAAAEAWYGSAGDRERRIEAAAGSIGPSELPLPPNTTSPMVDHPFATSPPFSQRGTDTHLASIGVYPTPPDGLVQGQATHQLNSDQATSVGAADQGNTGQAGVSGTGDEQMHDSTASSDPPALQDAANELFGDVGGVEFGGDEVEDADFDFFNEQDEDAEQPGEPSTAHEGKQGDETISLRAGSVQLGASAETNRSDELDADMLMTQSQEVTEVPSANDSVDQVLESSSVDGGLLRTIVSEGHPEKALSPLTIKERLLPPPVPASAASSRLDQAVRPRRRSTFAAVNFNAALDLHRKYAMDLDSLAIEPQVTPNQRVMSIGLPPRRKRPRLSSASEVVPESSSDDSDSDDRSAASEVGKDKTTMPPKLPWHSNGRKQPSYTVGPSPGPWDESPWEDQSVRGEVLPEPTETEISRVLDSVLSPNHSQPLTDVVRRSRNEHDSFNSADGSNLPDISIFYKLSKHDMVFVAQILGDQAATCLHHIVTQTQSWGDSPRLTLLDTTADDMAKTVSALIPEVLSCDVARLALTREGQNRAQSAPAPRPGQPRPVQRLESINLGPDIMTIPPPYTRVQRGHDTYEMIPPALEFWKTLSLAPTNGPKDVRAFIIFPIHEELQGLVEGFLSDVRSAYEDCKLGSHEHVRNVQDDNEEDAYEDGLVDVEVGDPHSTEAVLRAYGTVCMQLGTFLASIGHLESERTIVVYLVNPFPETVGATKHLVACFWQLYKAYRDKCGKPQRGTPRSDIVLQIVPMQIIASPDAMVVLESKQLAAIAKEVYNRCPPSAASTMNTRSSALPIYNAPFAELASPPPKRIGFSLTADPPTDLLQEGSVLHLACVTSSDGQWLTASWSDSTGRYQDLTSLSLRGKTLAEVAEDVWERTRDILAAREVSWRVFIVVDGIADDAIQKCWRQVIEPPRKQAFSVTLLSADASPDLRLSTRGPASDPLTSLTSAGGAFLTPVTTPSATATTTSPDAVGHNAPPTPAPSDSTATAAEADPDAHLVDLADETWGMLFSPTFSTVLEHAGLANGALFKRGQMAANSDDTTVSVDHLPSLVLKLCWTVQVRANSNIDEGNVKQAEMTLREVLKMYRNLSVLTRARGLANGDAAALPVHLVVARMAAEQLSGLMS